ncbi:DUF4270 family protein [Myroides sp. LJL119]
MSQKNIFKGFILSLGLIALQGCDADFNNTGSDIIGGGDYSVESYVVKDIKAYNQPTGAVESSKLPEFSIGALKDDFFGDVSNSLALNFSANSVDFNALDNTAVFDSVYVYIPFYNTVPDKLEDEFYTYKLNSVYGEGNFDLKVFQNNYLISLDNPIAGGSIYYYNNDYSLFNDNHGGMMLNDSRMGMQNSYVSFNNTAINIYKYDEQGAIETDDDGKPIVKQRLDPGFWLDLNLKYFQDFFINNREALADSELFGNVFRGLYMKASTNGSQGAIGLLALGQGYLRATYERTQTKTDSEGNETSEKIRGEIKLPLANFGGASSGSLANTSNSIINLMSTTNDQGYLGAIANPNKELGDELLYIKGGQGSMAIIELFKEDDFQELKTLKEQEVLINDAFLTVHVNRDIIGENTINPPRLFLYNYDNSSVIADFANDSSLDKNVYGGEYVKKADDSKREPYTYRVRVRDHIQTLLDSDKLASPKLALVVSNEYTSTMNELSFKKLKTPIVNVPQDVTTIPSYSVTCPLGTVVYGTNSSVPQQSKMELEIFYTKIK